ncbi:MAG TPA: hypothetical protein PLD10_13150 [Rhodopila sp.]|nr:hypothetical protein [Rhodopila sp.]
MSRTPGNWFYDPATMSIKSDHPGLPGIVFAAIYYSSGHSLMDREIANTNGQLIAAAPRMFDALHALIEAAAPVLGDDDPAIQTAREIISRFVTELMK